MNDYCIRQDIGKAEAIRQGIKKLKDDKKKIECCTATQMILEYL